MKSIKEGYGYNERLFSGGFRSRIHLARFYWLVEELEKRKCSTDVVLELGCFDGKVIEFLPQKPKRYIGFDANWEGGLDLAKEKWKDYKSYSFHQISTPEEICFDNNEIFDLAIAMETLEHIAPELIDDYLQKIANNLNGYFFVTVPNEKGIVFLIKWLAKKIFSKDARAYTVMELVNATLGRMHLVARNQHKGFDYASLVKNIEKYFEVIEVIGHPFGFLPHPICYGIGIIAKSKKQ